MTSAGMMPDPWLQRLLVSTAARVLLLYSRQAGKFTVAAASHPFTVRSTEPLCDRERDTAGRGYCSFLLAGLLCLSQLGF